MCRIRLHHAWGLLVVVLVTAMLSPTGRAATTRPHPLFGNSVLGNSAELVTMWPTGTAGVDSLRITNFVPLPNPGWLNPRPSDACTGGPDDGKYQQLDVTTGDFDGDGRDDMVAAYSLPTTETWKQRVVLEVPDIRSGPLDWISGVSDTQGYVAVGRGSYRSPSNVRLASGNFDSDAPEEFVLGTRVQRNFHGDVHAGDYFGVTVAPIGDVDADGIDDLAISASGNDDGGSNRGGVWILFMRSDGTVRAQQKISDTQGGFTGVLDNDDYFGCGIASIGDLNGDGVPDIAVGAYGDDDGGSNNGAVWLLFLNRDGTVKSHVKIGDSATGGLSGLLDVNDYFGERMVTVGDFDDDGQVDLAVAATGDDDGGTDRGAVWLLFLQATGLKGYGKITNVSGLDNGDRFGYGLAYSPNFDGLGTRVLAVGAPYDDDGGTDRGAVWLYFLDGGVGLVKISSTSGGFGTGLDNGDHFGMSMAALPDLDGDGVCELAIGADGDDDGGTDRGAVHIIYPNATGAVKVKQKISSSSGGFGGSLLNSDQFGQGLACPGDLDGDGKADLVVGAPGDDNGGSGAGCVWFVYLATSGDIVKDQMENGYWWDSMLKLQLMELGPGRHPVTLAWCYAQEQDDGLIESTRFDVAAGDFDGDGIDEIVLGGVRRKDNGNMEVFVTIYAYEGGVLVEKVTSAYGNQPQELASGGRGHYFDHVVIKAAPLDPATLEDRILFSWQDRYKSFYQTTSGCVWPWAHYYVTHTMYDYLSTLTVTTDGVWAIEGWDTDQKTVQDATTFGTGCSLDPGTPGEDYVNGAALGLATGDLTGDGRDEVVWVAADSVWVYQGQAGALVERTRSPRPYLWSDPSCRVVEVADLDASADADKWQAEFVVQDWGATGSKQRLRVFQATTDGSGVVNGLALRAELPELQIWQTQGDRALACGDFDGDALRLGEPVGPRTITDVVHPSVILGAPPVHFDVFEGAVEDTVFDLTGCYPGGSIYACDPTFEATYSQVTTQQYSVQTEIQSDWGLSTELKGWAEGFGAKVEARMKGTYGEHFGRTGAQTHTYTFSEFTKTDGVDRILADVMTYTLWEYPVMAGAGNVVGNIAVIEPGSMEPTPQWYTFDTWAALTGAQAPVITHEPGNVLSYPQLIPDTGEYGERWKAVVSGWEVGLPGAAVLAPLDDCPASHCFDLWWSDISGSSVEKSWAAGFEVGVSASYEYSDPMGLYKAGISVDVEGNYDTSEMSTHTVSVGEDIHLGATIGNLSGAAEAPYMVYPYVYRSSTTGTLVLDYKVEPAGLENWWDRYKVNPDLTFILPRLHRIEKGFPLEDPTTAYRSPDVRIMPDHVAVGDTVTIRAIVRNFSLVPSPSATVRFFAGDPDGAHTLIHDIHGVGEFATGGGIPVREGLPVVIQWIVPSTTPEMVRVYAQVDPEDAVTEVHEYNNKAYALLYAVGGNPLDVPVQTVGVPFRLEQSAPNPFRGSTLIAFGLPERTRVTLNVYDIAGRMIATVVDADLEPGRHEYRWDGRGRDGAAVRPGIYLYRIKAGAYGETRRLVRIN